MKWENRKYDLEITLQTLCEMSYVHISDLAWLFNQRYTNQICHSFSVLYPIIHQGLENNIRRYLGY